MSTKFFLAILAIGVIMGLCAGLLNFGINEIETFAFGHNDEEFHIITEQTTALRRFLSVLAAGAIVTIIRILLIRLKPFLNVASMMEGQNPPFWQNLIHSVLQLAAIAMGAPVGSEAAPRELGGLFAAKICRTLNIGGDELRLFVACGAGAGLGAVYNVPLAGALFSLEILLKSFDTQAILCAFATSAVATATAEFGASKEIYYAVSNFAPTPQNLLAAALIGLVTGVAAKYFQDGVRLYEKRRIKSLKIALTLPLAFLLTAAIGAYVPEILGNGRSAAQFAFNSASFSPYLLAILLCKAFCILMIFRCGGYGGTLTPSFALGAVLGLCVGFAIGEILPISLSAAGVCGGAAFLAINLNAPLCAFALSAGFCGLNINSYSVVVFSIVCAVGIRNLLTRNLK
ncbi:chloride channel protein [uncultured Campylobacter sp.]|uniref:chloride channel protein n=1 Tax=uncultured Campylobacter sp. TaxID=218934 RepID=UPI00261D160B|nr:chloride channel protein [uncultured Campylobacter sp.]